MQVIRSAFIGFVCSLFSDVTSNPIRVIKTIKQSSAATSSVSYIEVLRLILMTDGPRGLLFRGLTTRIFSNGFQSMIFTVLWKSLIQLKLEKKTARQSAASTVSI